MQGDGSLDVRVVPFLHMRPFPSPVLNCREGALANRAGELNTRPQLVLVHGD